MLGWQNIFLFNFAGLSLLSSYLVLKSDCRQKLCLFIMPRTGFAEFNGKTWSL